MSQPSTNLADTDAMVDKRERFLTLCGYSSPIDFIEDHTDESIVDGICMNPCCDYLATVEPDQESGFCEECKTQSVTSGFILCIEAIA